MKLLKYDFSQPDDSHLLQFKNVREFIFLYIFIS